ncbi:MAG: 8-oxo-dGTP diphosphatase MutT [Deferrisomatales bacterium]|nr:8-oxo-dGTP diphosphatase MutT [Deferrisomatales bacterium]
MTNPASPEPILVVAAVIRRADGRILLAQRLPGGPHGGLWEFPGGKLEPGETSEEALVREIREELGITVEVGERLLTVEHTYPHLAIRLTAYDCRVSKGAPRRLHCQDLCWVSPAGLLERPMPAADLPIARLVSGRLGS